MARRMIDTDFWNRPEVRALKAPYKLLWSYLNCACDHAGIWVVELDVAALRLGVKLDREEALLQFGSLVEDHGGKWLLTTFQDDQYGVLNPGNKVHASVMQRVDALRKEGSTKGLSSPYQGAKDKDKDKDKELDKEEEEEKERAKPEPIAMTWPTWAGPNTLAKWEEFKAYRKEQHRIGYKSARTEQAAIDLLAKYYADGKACVDGLSLAIGKGWRFPVDPAELGSNGKAPTPAPAPTPIGWQTPTGK